ncbi:hypothetical protein GHT09_004888 [Marmota monax]|uniref:Uncharacterized protein n=2 Tax=Marmota monax TaxID=9995 RepID=A0A834V6L2_MARMO|nr:hypothetical protein GHT09_004888 [Marmota monax]
MLCVASVKNSRMFYGEIYPEGWIFYLHLPWKHRKWSEFSIGPRNGKSNPFYFCQLVARGRYDTNLNGQTRAQVGRETKLCSAVPTQKVQGLAFISKSLMSLRLAPTLTQGLVRAGPSWSPE